MTNDDTKHPNDLPQLTLEVDKFEAWLAETMNQYPEPPCRVLEQVKMRTGIATCEHALDERVSEQGEMRVVGSSPVQPPSVQPPSVQTLLAVKGAVRDELASGIDLRGGRRWLPYSGALMAAAAAIALVVIPTGWWTSHVDRPGTVSLQGMSPLEDLAYVLTVSVDSDSDWESELGGFETDLDDFADSFVDSDDDPDDLDFGEFGVDELEDAIDALLRDSNEALDT